MKKSIRILSLVMSIVMLSGIFSVFASAAKYTGTSIVTYDDLDNPVYTSNQYATMLVDYLDNMLAEMNLVLTKDDIFVGELDVRSLNSAFAGVKSLWASVDSLKSVVGDIGSLDISVLTSLSRDETVADRDKQILYNVLDFLAGNAWVFGNYANHNLNVGAVQSLISGYMFYIKDLAVGLLYGLIDDDYDYFDSFTLPNDPSIRASNGHATEKAIANLLTVVVEKVLLGTWTKLDDIIDDEDNKITAAMYDFDMSYEENKDNYDFYGWVMYDEDDGEIDDEWVCSSLGGTKIVDEDAAAPAKVNEYLDFTNAMAMYPMLEKLLVRAYNHILVPWINRQIINWLREECDIVDYNENTENLSTELDEVRKNNQLAQIINIDEVVKSTFTARNLTSDSETYTKTGGTVLTNLNNILGDLINGTSLVTKDGVSAKPLVNKNYTLTVNNGDTAVSYQCTWKWESGDNSNLLPNICSVGRFILAVAGSDLIEGCGGPELFYDPVGFVASEDNKSTAIQTDEELVAYLLRIILNDSLDFCVIPNTCKSLRSIAFSVVQQWAYIETPELTYTTPASESDYIDAIFNILANIAAKSLNQELDAVYTTSGSSPNGVSKQGLDYYNGSAWTYFDKAYDPVSNNGLLPVSSTTSYGTILTMLACWGVTTYGSIFDGILTLNCDTTNSSTVTLAKVWQDLDTILNSLIPIKENAAHEGKVRDDSPWIGADPIKTATKDPQNPRAVTETIVFDYFLNALLDFNLGKVLSILYDNTSGALHNNPIEKVLVDLVHRLFDLLFPNVFDNTVSTLDGFLSESNVPAFLYDLIECLGTKSRDNYKKTGTINGRGAYILELAFPIVASMMDLDSEQEFGELENFAPDQIIPESGTYKFNLYNASQGVNTSYRSKKSGSYQRYQDNLYKYEIRSFAVTVLNGGFVTQTQITDTNKYLYGGESLKITLSNLSDGMILRMVTEYIVYDENGTAFKNGSEDRILTNTKYSYVGSEKDDDSVYSGSVTTSGSGYVQYPASKYVNATSNLSSVDGYSVRIRNREYANGENSDIIAKVTSVSGTAVSKGLVVANTEELHMTSSKGTYSFNPVKAVAGKTRDQFESGSYDVTVNMSVEGVAKSFTFYIILYNDYGLVSLTNRALDKNYSANDSSDSTKWTAYNTALEAAAKVALTPRSKGTFLTEMAKAESLAANLTKASEDLQGVLTSASAMTVWNSVNAIGAYDYSLAQVKTSDGTEIKGVYYKNVVADYDTIATTTTSGVYSSYISADDYAPGVYSKFRTAKNEANDVAMDGMKIIDSSWLDTGTGKLKTVDTIIATIEKPANYLTNEKAKESYDSKVATITSTYNSIVNYEEPVVSNVQASYSMSKLELMYSRLIPVAPCVTRLSSLLTEYSFTSSGYTKASWSEFSQAKEFATLLVNNASKKITRTIGSTSLSEYVVKPSMVKEATERLIKASKNLVKAANNSTLVANYNSAYETLFMSGYIGFEGYNFMFTKTSLPNPVADEWIYNTFMDFLETYLAAEEYYNGKYASEEKKNEEYPAAKQTEINQIAKELATKKTALINLIDNHVPVPPPVVSLLNDQEWTTSNEEVEYIPTIDNKMLSDYDLSYTATVGGKNVAVTEVLYGIMPNYIDEALSVKNGSVVVTEATGSETASSGSIVTIYDKARNINKVYLVIYAGDNNGDGNIDSTDAQAAASYTFFKTDWDETNDGTWKYISSDVNGDGNVDSNDYVAIAQTHLKKLDINQNPIGIIKPTT